MHSHGLNSAPALYQPVSVSCSAADPNPYDQYREVGKTYRNRKKKSDKTKGQKEVTFQVIVKKERNPSVHI